MYGKIENALSANCKLMLDDLKQDGEAITFMDILEKDKHWTCQTCKELYSKDIIFCNACLCFRPLEMFKNLVNNPGTVTNFEVEYLKQRRTIEKQKIMEQDMEDLDDDKEEDPMQFIISADWLYLWKCFISNRFVNSSKVSQQLKQKVQSSSNEVIGVLPPGPICNLSLFIGRDKSKGVR